MKNVCISTEFSEEICLGLISIQLYIRLVRFARDLLSKVHFIQRFFFIHPKVLLCSCVVLLFKTK